MNDFYTSVVRSLVPAIVASVVDFLAHRGLNIDPNGTGGLEAALFSVFYGAYYVVIRLFEHYVSPKFGWLLGYAQKPQYTSTVIAPASPAVDNPSV